MRRTTVTATTAPVALVGSVALAVGVAGPASAADEHTVEPGDTVTGVAIKHGLQTSDVLAWNDLGHGSTIRPGQTLRLSPQQSTAKPAPAEPQTKTHTVAAGDTLWSIAQRHGTSVDSLLKANGLKASSVIHPEQKLTLPGNAQSVSASTTSQKKASSPSAKAHTVAPGDTLWAIARANETTVAAILQANGLDRGAIIYPGQTLRIHASSAHTPDDDDAQQFASLDSEQRGNARLIIRVGREIGASDRAIATALATAMVESSLRNRDHGDRDSLGLFQQRPSQGWGTPSQITDPKRSTMVFFGGSHDPNGQGSRGLYDIEDWHGMSFGDAAQAVQRSAYPGRYAQWEVQAHRWVSDLG